MGCTVDHLRSNVRVRVVQDFVDARGAAHRAGERAVIRQLELQWARQELVLTWERDGQIEELVFSLAAKVGPRNGHMRDYFADEGDVPAPVRRVTGAVALPPLRDDPVAGSARYREGVSRVAALAAQMRWVEAEEQVRLILAAGESSDGVLQDLAGDLVELAVAAAWAGQVEAQRWLGHRAIDLWYTWGSGATSGGDGAARAVSIRAAEARLHGVV